MFQITLKKARDLSGYSPEEAANSLEISVAELEEFEEDSGDMKRSLIGKLSELYGLPSDVIYFGTKADCALHNRKMFQFFKGRVIA